MRQDQTIDPKRRYLPCLEGIRGYGFLLVFCGHYLSPVKELRPDTFLFRFCTAIRSISVFAVPAFFVLSGYLIGGILYHTRNREGFFKVFYFRRILRVFPVYYLTLTAILLFFVIHRMQVDGYFWLHYLYVQNLFPGYEARMNGSVGMTHFWSLAVEEQFYLLWPLIVWRFRDRTKLIWICSGLIATCCVLRLASPLLPISVGDMSFVTFNRVDAVLLGVLLNLVSGTNWMQKCTPLAKWVVIGGAILTASLGFIKGESWAMSTYAGKETWITLANFTALAVVVAVLEEGSLLNRMCSQKWICMVGALSYSLYVFHLTYVDFFFIKVKSELAVYMSRPLAALASAGMALCTTFVLSYLTYLCIERPLMSLKGRLKYGADRTPQHLPNPERAVAFHQHLPAPIPSPYIKNLNLEIARRPSKD